jgi:hypothetical protein
VAAQGNRRAVSRGGRKLRLAACAAGGVALGLLVFALLIELGLVRNPLGPFESGDLALARSGRPGLRVLFVGNSFTYENSLPELVHELAGGDPDARPIFAVELVKGGWTLRAASHDGTLPGLLAGVRWNAVVLQEQSEELSFPAWQRRREVYPFAQALAARIAAAGARTMLFMTWGYRLGDRRNRAADSFEAMQARLEQGYDDLGRRLSAPVAPVGAAWREALRRRPGIDLWAGDGRHPNRAGSYLAACVFFAVLERRDPTRSSFDGGLSAGEARFLKRVAGDVAGVERAR